MRMKPHSLVGWSLENIQNEFWRNDGNALCDWLVSTNAALWYRRLISRYEKRILVQSNQTQLLLIINFL